MLAWVQNMGKKRRRTVGDLGNGRSSGGGGASDMLPKAITAAVVLLVGDSMPSQLLTLASRPQCSALVCILCRRIIDDLHAMQLLVVAGMTWRHHFDGAASTTADSAATDRPLAGSSTRGKPGQPKVYTYSIERQLEHSPEAFTQGLEFDRSCQRNEAGTEECTDVLWESTGDWRSPCSLTCHMCVCDLDPGGQH